MSCDISIEMQDEKKCKGERHWGNLLGTSAYDREKDVIENYFLRSGIEQECFGPQKERGQARLPNRELIRVVVGIAA